MPGTKKCEIGCTCGHHPQGMLPRDAYAAQRQAKNNARSQKYRTPEQQRRYALKHAHGMTPEDWDAMWSSQQGRCCYCELPLPVSRRQVHVDHDHSCCPPKRSCSRCRRGLSCQNCNFVVGNAQEDPERLELISKNLRRLKFNCM